jgi:DNA polymerase III alpha subunit
MVLEAQTFNILTEREKHQIVNIADKYNHDILNTIKDVTKNLMIGDDNKKIMSEKRFETFKKKYAPYKEIYEKNVGHQKFANWYFEKKLLGYSYSYNIRDIFKDNEDKRFTSTLEFNSSENNTNIRVVGWISESEKRTSRNGNKYLRVSLQDELGNLNAMLMDGRDDKMTNYFESGGIVPKKDSIVVLTGRKSNDTMFLDNIFILDEKIYMKLSELK